MDSPKILLDPYRSIGILSTKLWIRGGSRADPINKKGIHNLLAALLTRGCGPYNSCDISDLIEGCGAELQCESYEDGIMISLKCTEHKSPELLPLISLMVTEPLLKEDQFLLEKKLTIQLLSRQKESLFYITFNNWKKIAYPNHVYKYDSIGTINNLEDISLNDICTLSKTLISRKKTIVISGSIPENVENYFQTLRTNKSFSNSNKETLTIDKTINRSKNRFNNESVILNYQNTNQVVIMFGNVTIPHSHVDDLALRIISCHLGSGMSSLLFKKLREKNGLTYDIGVYHPIKELEVPFLIHASSTVDKSMLTLKLINQCWEDIQTKCISKEELNLAKAKFIGNLAHNSQSISQRAERMAYLLGINMKEDHDIQVKEKINSITEKEILRVASIYFKDPLISLSGPKDTLNNISQHLGI